MERKWLSSEISQLIPSILLLLLLGSTLVGLLLIELLLRFYLFGMNSLSITKVNITHSLEESCSVALARLPELIYELNPNLSTTFKMVQFETNSKGLRDKEYLLSAPVNTVRVAVIGDLLTMGSGVSIDIAPSIHFSKIGSIKSSMNTHSNL